MHPNTPSSLTERYQQARRPSAMPEAALMSGFPPKAEDRVTWSNWMQPPFNRWGFRNLARIRPSIDVQAGTGPVFILGETPLPLESLRFDSTCGSAVNVADHLVVSHTDAFLVLREGQVVFERYFNGQTAQDRHIMFSVTKSLIGVLGEQLVSEGVLDDQAPATRYVPELQSSAFAGASVRQLFDMAVGIHYSEVYDDPNSESSQYGYACGFQPAPVRYAQFASLYEYLPTLRKRGEHGNVFHYVTAVTEALAWVMERASGRSCAQLLETLWEQLGCERDGYFMADPWGRGVAGAGFSATLRDMARFGLLLANRGQHEGQQLLAAPTIERIAGGADPGIYANNAEFSQWTPGASYRSQWYVFNDHSQALMAGGIHGQYLFVDLPAQVVIVKQSSLPAAVTDLDADSVRMLRAIAAHLRP